MLGATALNKLKFTSACLTTKAQKVRLQVMEVMLKKYQRKFRKVNDEMEQWEELQSQLLSQFSSASAILQRLQVIQDSRNYGALECIEGIVDAISANQMESLQTILLSMNKIMENFCGVSLSLEKIVRDGRQLVKGGSVLPTAKQLQQRVGIKPSLADCVDGLGILSEMHHSEYLLKLSVVSSLAAISLKPSASDYLSSLQQLLADQPNIPREEVQLIFDIIFAEEIS